MTSSVVRSLAEVFHIDTGRSLKIRCRRPTKKAVRPSYAQCIRRSRAANWELQYFEDIELDFSRPFLPEGLAGTQHLAMLAPDERLRLNQIRGHAYAYIFRFVEEYIISLVETLQASDLNDDRDRPAALAIFLAEERKHQELFALFERHFREGFPASCGVIEGMREVAETLMTHSRFSLLLLTAMLEWLTQAHYLAYFDDTDPIDEGFKELFRLHWVEEAQHARLDAIETQREAETLSRTEVDAGVEELLGLCDVLKALFRQQAQLDSESLQRVIGRELGSVEVRELTEQQTASYVHTFIALGLQNRHFRGLVNDLTPAGLSVLDQYLDRLSQNA